MTKEIKFRLWNAWLKRFEKDFEIRRDFNKFTFWVDDNENDEVVELDEINQFTGLKDKNGKEIYEGDIVKCKVKRGVQEFKGNALIIWSDNLMFDVERLDDGLVEEYESLGNYTMDNYEIEVIGNIYENQEILSNSSPPVRTQSLQDCPKEDLI